MKTFALIGNPNCGKTTLFNSLTGSTSKVGNWAGVTVDKKVGLYKKIHEKIEVVDLPGIYSLSPYTPEEIVSRNFIIDENPDCVINIVDVTNLERNLYLTTQLIEMDVPVVVALNMTDLIKKQGDLINLRKLIEILDVPVIEVSALKGKGLDLLMSLAYETSKKPRQGKTLIEHEQLVHLINDVKIGLLTTSVSNPLYHAIKLVEADKIESKAHPDLVAIVNAFKKSHEDDVYGEDYEALLADARYKYISKHFEEILIKKDSKNTLNKSDKIDKVLTHKIWAIPIFIVLIFLIFHLTFGNDLFFMGRMGLRIDNEFWVNFFTGMRYSGQAIQGIPGPGVWFQSWVSSGIENLTGWIRSLFASGGVDGTWYCGLVCDGLLKGIGTVISFVPQILLLFLFVSLLEDSGYMARIAFILDRVFRKFGLSGKAFIPMITGFGCSVPAIMSTRTLEDEKEKNRTIRLITCFPCGAKAPIWTLLATIGSLSIGLGDLFVFTIYLGGVALAVILAILMKIFSKNKYVSPFIMELPSYHSPQFKNVMIKLWEKLKKYLINAGTVIAASLVVIWFLESFGWNAAGEFGYLKGYIEGSFLAYIGKGLSYAFYPLGWTIGPDGWKYMVASISGLVAKENVVSTLAALGLTGATIKLSAFGAYSFAAFNLLTLPCIASIATAKAEQTKKEFLKTLLFWFSISYIISAIIYWLGSLFNISWWGGLIVIFVAILLLIQFCYIKSRKDKHNALKVDI